MGRCPVEVRLHEGIIQDKLHGHIERSASNAMQELTDLGCCIKTRVVRGNLELICGGIDMLPLSHIPLEVLASGLVLVIGG